MPPEYDPIMANIVRSGTSGLRVRAGQQSDAEALLRFERATLPMNTGERLLFADADYAQKALTEALADTERVFVSVAELDGEAIGCAVASPLALPGEGNGSDRWSMVLQVLFVETDFRSRGVATALLEHVEERCRAARQWVIVAHVPGSAASSYRNAGWEVLAPGSGFAWLPFGHFLRGDIPDPDIGFGLEAVKVLRPKSMRRTFAFPVETHRPFFDAASELLRIIETGDIDVRDLDDATRESLTIGR